MFIDIYMHKNISIKTVKHTNRSKETHTHTHIHTQTHTHTHTQPVQDIPHTSSLMEMFCCCMRASSVLWAASCLDRSDSCSIPSLW